MKSAMFGSGRYDSLIKIGGTAVSSLVPLLVRRKTSTAIRDGDHSKDRKTRRRALGHGTRGGRRPPEDADYEGARPDGL